MKHINECTKEELQQEYGIACHNEAVVSVLGSKKQLKKAQQYKDAVWERLKEIDPVNTNINEDELLAELFN